MRVLLQDQEEIVATEHQLTHSLTPPHSHSNVINHTWCYTQVARTLWCYMEDMGGWGEFPSPGKEKMCNTRSFQFYGSHFLSDICFPWPLYYLISRWSQGISYTGGQHAFWYKSRFLKPFLIQWVLKPVLTEENLCFWHYIEWKRPNMQQDILYDPIYNAAYD